MIPGILYGIILIDVLTESDAYLHLPTCIAKQFKWISETFYSWRYKKLIETITRSNEIITSPVFNS